MVIDIVHKYYMRLQEIWYEGYSHVATPKSLGTMMISLLSGKMVIKNTRPRK